MIVFSYYDTVPSKKYWNSKAVVKSITSEEARGLVESVGRKLDAVIASKEYATKL